MLESPEDAYTNYLQGLLYRSDVNENIVRETLASMGYSSKCVDDMLGQGSHECCTSGSSDLLNSTSQSRVESVLNSSSPEKFPTSPIPQENRTAMLSSADSNIHVHLEDDTAQHPGTSAFSSSSLRSVSASFSSSPSSASAASMSLSASPLPSSPVWKTEGKAEVGPRGLVLTPPTWKGSERLKPSSSFVESWGETIINPERRERYLKHLCAIEELLGVRWLSNGDNTASAEFIPLEVRGFICRQRLENLVLNKEEKHGDATQSRQRGRKDKSTVFTPAPHDKPKTRKGRSGGAAVHSRCWRHLTGYPCMSTSYTAADPPPISAFVFGDIRRRNHLCELCTNLDDGSFSLGRKGESVYLQKTASAPVGEACGVKMRPRVLSTIGTGRLNTKAMATTLMRREDRVKKGQAYREEWYDYRLLQSGHVRSKWGLREPIRCRQG